MDSIGLQVFLIGNAPDEAGRFNALSLAGNVVDAERLIDQMNIIYQAANRQNHIDQGQSLNLMIHPDMSAKEINKLYVTAWKLGLKSLYYQHSMNAAQKFKQNKECSSCEG